MKNSFLVLLIACLLVGCSNGVLISTKDDQTKQNSSIGGEGMDFQGIVMEKTETSVIVVVGLAENEVEGKTIREILTLPHAKTYELEMSKINTSLNVGDRVNVWTNGLYEESRIVKTSAIKIEIVKK